MLAAAVIGAAAVALAPGAAHAGEAGYLARIGVDYDFPVLDESEALRAGYEICAKLRNGIPREHIAEALFWNMEELTREQADGIPYAAQRELCPETAQ
ncbi:membrane protein [Mycobacterium phage Guanica15]|nr:membrane protein [Mycobacterium phage Efra2]QFG11654.1 membrane protein [Mycobacterium phage Guanica15]